MTSTRSVRTMLAAALPTMLLTACASVPIDGPVRSSGGSGDRIGDAPFGIQAAPPRPGATAYAIVSGFLDAMSASSSNDIARQYLTAEAAASWRPELGATIYDRSDRKAIRQSNGRVLLEAPALATLDARGVWQAAAPGQRLSFDFALVKDRGGQLRISHPPAGLLLDNYLFESGYELRNLYFFTPKMDALVPDPVYLPSRGPDGQSATVLAQALLAGPTSRLGDAVQTAAPKDTEVVSVPVDPDGVATVALNDRVNSLDPDLRRKLAAQLAWTLRQVPGVLKLRFTAGGAPLEVDGSTDELPITTWDSYDAAFATGTGRQLFLLHNDVVDRFGDLDPVGQQAPVGQRLAGLSNLSKTSLAVDIDGQLGAAVSSGKVVVGPIAPDGPEQADDLATVHTDGRTLRPSFDKDRNVWIVDRADEDARIRVRRNGSGTVLTVNSTALTGRQLTAFRVARDGVRVLVVTRRSGRSALMVGRITGTERAVTISALRELFTGFTDIADAGWSWPTKVTVLGRNSGSYRPLEINVDGSEPVAIRASEEQDFNPVELATAPDSEALPVVRNSDGTVLVQRPDLSWRKLPQSGHPVYPG